VDTGTMIQVISLSQFVLPLVYSWCICIRVVMTSLFQDGFVDSGCVNVMSLCMPGGWQFVSWVLASIMTESSCCFWKCNRNSGMQICTMFCPEFWVRYFILIWTYCQELMKSVGSHGSSSLLFYLWWRW
jgi:hypothetical protein